VRSTEEGPVPEARARPSAPAPVRRPRRRRGVLLAMLALLLVVGAYYGVKTVVFYEHHEETDDAQIEANIDPVLPRVTGYVTEVAVQDNEKVAKGQVLVRIDRKDLEAKLQMADAALANARARVTVDQARLSAERAGRMQADSDVARYRPLAERQELSRQRFEAAQAEAKTAGAREAAARRQVEAARAQVVERQADVDYARLQLSYAEIVSPAGGVVSKKSVEVGQLVQAGQPLMAIVEDQDVWVVANFKETQLRKMRVGQPVEVEVDTYSNRVFHGRVESLAAATGAKFALLPPDNATGNFVKVVQRVPVKIVFTDPPDPRAPLRAGMSVTAIVRVD
jgi:membrane fusion protein (multidrug efflux system)